MTTTKYSASPTHSGVTISLDSGAGTDYDTIIAQGDQNAQNTTFIPNADIIIAPDDKIIISAPPGGGSITSASTIYCEELL